MSAISATRGAYRETADGSLEVKIIIDPRFVAEFHRLFAEKDMPVAIAPLVADFERKEAMQGKGGPLAKLAGMWCREASFLEWIAPVYDRRLGGNGAEWGDMSPDEMTAEEFCRHAMLVFCGIDSRAELDNNPLAARMFNETIRAPYMAWVQQRNEVRK